MYISRKKMEPYKNRFAKRPSRGSRYGIPLAIFIILVGAAWMLWDDSQLPGEQTRSELQVAHDLQALWSWSDQELLGGAETAAWTVRWDLSLKVGGFDQLQRILFTDEKGNALEKVVENEGRTVSGRLLASEESVSIHKVETKNDGEQVMLLLEMSRKEQQDQGQVLAATAALSEQITRLKAAFTTSIKVQGKTRNKEAIAHIAKLAQATKVDRYEDGGTISATYFTNKLYSTIRAGGGKLANLQIALHQDTDGKSTELTIGIPVITGEYSASVTD